MEMYLRGLKVHKARISTLLLCILLFYSLVFITQSSYLLHITTSIYLILIVTISATFILAFKKLWRHQKNGHSLLVHKIIKVWGTFIGMVIVIASYVALNYTSQYYHEALHWTGVYGLVSVLVFFITTSWFFPEYGRRA